MQFDTTYLTEAGRSLATGTLGGLDKIQFTRAVASSHDYSATPVNDLKKLTSIEDVQQTVDYSRIIKKDDTTLTMRVDFPSKDVTKAYSLYTVGFYARPENGDEILYGVLPSSLPDYIAAYDGKSNLNDSFQTDTTVSDADNVLITVSQAGSLNEADLDAIFASKHIATIDDIKANIPATVIDGSKPADFKESVILEKGAVDGAGNAIATAKNVSDGDAETLKSAKDYADTKVSGKADDSAVVHTADMRKLANQVASIDEVNAKQDKIGYTPADDSTVLHNNSLNRITTDDSGIIVGNEQNFGIIKRSGSPAGIAVVSGKNFRFMATNDVVLSNNSSYHDVWNISPTGQISILDGAYFTPADDSKVVHNSEIDPSVIVKTTLTNTDNVLTLGAGTYWVWGTAPKNYPTSVPWGTVVVKLNPISTTGMNKLVEVTDTSHNRVLNTYSGSPATWSGWHIPNENSVVKDNGDDTVTINGKSYVPANAANVVDRNPDTGVVSEPVDFTKLTVNGGKSVATRDDLKSLEASSWLSLGMPKGSYKNDSLSIDHIFLGSPLYMKYDTDTETTTLSGSFLLGCDLVNVEKVRSWNGALITLPDGFYVSDEDLIEFVKFLVSDTSNVEINSASKSGNDIIASLKYTNSMVTSGFTFGVTVSGAYGSNFRQYVTNKTTKLIKKV